MGRPGKRHIIDPFRPTEMLCGLARCHHGPEAFVDGTDLGLEVCSRCAKRLDELRGVMRTGKTSRVFEQPCSSCGAPAGMPCLTTESRPTTGHTARVRLERAMNGSNGKRWEEWTARARAELALVLDWATAEARERNDA